MVISAREDDSLTQFFWGLYDTYVSTGQVSFPAASARPTFDLFADSDQYIEDMPWFTSGELVSSRLRDLLMRLEPDRFFVCDTRILYQDSIWLDRGQYFMVFATNVVKCHDQARTTWRRGIKRHLADKFFLDPEQVPSDTHLFRAFGRESKTIISHKVREEMDSAGMKGCCYFPPDDLVPLW
ncbi:MAG: hypothetical protein HEQ23_06065 [Tepidisphaera sp.]